MKINNKFIKSKVCKVCKVEGLKVLRFPMHFVVGISSLHSSTCGLVGAKRRSRP